MRKVEWTEGIERKEVSNVIHTSFKGVKGISGGPLFRNNEIIGMMAFLYTEDSSIIAKNKAGELSEYDSLDTYAFSIDEILKRLKK